MTKDSRILAILVLLALGVGFGVSCATRSDPTVAEAPPSEGLAAELATTQAELAETQDKLEELSAAFSQHFLVSGQFYEVTKVVDGDTFELGKFKVRLLGVNTPESVHPSQPVAWYGVESSQHMKKLLLGKKVRLEPEEGERLGTGAYNRVLAYPYLEDGTDVAKKVVLGGYGRSYHKYPCKRRAEFDGYEATAKAAGLGLWNDEGRLAWEDTHIIPDVPASKAKVIVAKSGIVHDVACGAGPSVKNGTFFETIEQAAKFRFTRLHSCLEAK